jgi:uncharacterized protein (TIGR02265 family)
VAQAVERLVFEVSFRSVFDWLAPEHQPAVEAEWKAIGVDQRKLLPAYPVASWWKAIEIVASKFEGSRRDRLRKIGRGLAEGYGNTFIGKAVLPLARLIGPRRTLLRAGINFRAGNNFVEATIDLDEPFHIKIRVNDVSTISEMFAGSIEGMVTITGGSNPQVEFIEQGSDTIYDVRWSGSR